MKKLSKLQRKKRKERLKEKAWQEVLQKAKHKHKNDFRLLNQILQGKVPYYRLQPNSGWRELAYILEYEWPLEVEGCNKYKPNRKAFIRIIIALMQNKAQQVVADGKAIRILKNIARFKAFWIRDIDSWKPRGRKVERLLATLSRHLLAQYAVPTFLDKVWYEGSDAEQLWFIEIGQGKNIRKARNLPIPMTKKMAHHFLQSPSHYQLIEAFRRGQVLGMGGSKKLAKAVVSSRLGESLVHNAFWESVIHFLINSDCEDYIQINPVIEYIQSQKFGISKYLDGYFIELPAENPDFSVKGRTLNSIWRAISKRIDRLGNLHIQWRPYEIGNAIYEVETETGVRTYRVQQLLTSHELEQEGSKMRHCVASYVSNCVQGECSIWSLKMSNEEGQEIRLLTIELDQNLEIQQALGKNNRRPHKEEMNILKRWVSDCQLKISEYLNN